MKDSSVHLWRVRPGVGIAIAIAGLLAACGTEAPSVESLAAMYHLDPQSMLVLDDATALAVRPGGGGIGVELVTMVANGRGGWEVGTAASDAQTVDGGLVGMVSFEGDTGMNWNMFVFGTGPTNVASVRMLERQGRAELVDLASHSWVIALRHYLPLESMRWQLVDADGEVIYNAQGLVPADQ